MCLLGRLPGEKEIRGCSVRGWRGGEMVGRGGGLRGGRVRKGFRLCNEGSRWRLKLAWLMFHGDRHRELPEDLGVSPTQRLDSHYIIQKAEKAGTFRSYLRRWSNSDSHARKDSALLGAYFSYSFFRVSQFKTQTGRGRCQSWAQDLHHASQLVSPNSTISLFKNSDITSRNFDRTKACD